MRKSSGFPSGPLPTLTTNRWCFGMWEYGVHLGRIHGDRAPRIKRLSHLMSLIAPKRQPPAESDPAPLPQDLADLFRLLDDTGKRKRAVDDGLALRLSVAYHNGCRYGRLTRSITDRSAGVKDPFDLKFAEIEIQSIEKVLTSVDDLNDLPLQDILNRLQILKADLLLVDLTFKSRST